jgi:hypothetical protein
MAIAVGLRTWLERVEANRFDDWTKERMVKEMPHTEEGSIRRAPPHEARTRHTAIAAGHAG